MLIRRRRAISTVTVPKRPGGSYRPAFTFFTFFTIFTLTTVAPADAAEPESSAASAASAPATADSLSLAEAIDRALNALPAMVEAHGAVRTARAAGRTAMGSYLPTLTAGVTSSRTWDGTSTSSPAPGGGEASESESYGARASLSYDLYTGGRRGAQRVQAIAGEEAALAGLTARQYAARATVKAAFYEALRAEELIHTAEARILRARRLVEAAVRQHDLGSATRSDLLRAQIEQTSAQEALVTARTRQLAAAWALGRLVGADGPVSAKLDRTLEVVPLALSDEQIVQAALSASPRIRAQQSAVRSAEAGVAAARSAYLPSAQASASYGWSNRALQLDDGRSSWSASLSVGLTLFDGFAREEQAERATVGLANARATLDDTEREVRAEVNRLAAQLRLEEERTTLAEETVAAAGEDLRVQQGRYAVGASTILDLLTSEASLVEAQSNLISAFYDYQVTLAELETWMGRQL